MSNSNMTPEQAAEVLRRHKEGAEELLKTAPAPNGEMFLSDLTAAIETAIECLTQATETNLEKAKRLYPKGTKFVCVVYKCVNESSGEYVEEENTREIWVEGSGGYVYAYGEWASIVSTPEQEQPATQPKPFDPQKSLDAIKKWISENKEEHDKIVERITSQPKCGPTVAEYFEAFGSIPAQTAIPAPTDYCPCTPDETTGEMSANEGKTWQCNICGKTVNPSDHTRLNTPTDDQIGKLFDQHTDVSVLLNPISPTHAMTRTAAIQFAREVLTLGKSK